MSAPDTLPSLLRALEGDLNAALPRIARQARDALQRPGRGEVPCATAARDMLEGTQGGRFTVAWQRALQAALREGPALSVPNADAPTTLAAALTLKDKEEIDEDIELARLAQDLEAGCEAVMRELRQLYSGLRGLDHVDLQAPPLTPQRCAATVREAVVELRMVPGARLALLRAVVSAAVQHLPTVLSADLRRVKEARVQPASYQIRPGAALGVRSEAGGADVEGRIQSVLNRLMADAGPLGAQGEPPPGAVSDAWMDGVLQAVVREARPSPAMQRLLSRLAEPGQRLARAEPHIWQEADHAWWALLDRLLAWCAVLDSVPGGAQDRFAAQCDDIVSRLVPADGSMPDSALCRSVLEKLTTAAQTLAEAPAHAPEQEGGGLAPSSGLLKLVREQMSQQLRVSDAPGSLRRFLMGPWLRVLALSLDPQRGDTAQAQQFTEWVDRVLGSLRSAPGDTDLHQLLDDGRTGLVSIGLPEAQIATWMEDLHRHLEDRRNEPQPDAEQAPAWRHEDLPTVPIDLHPSAHGARARRDRIAWINGLRVGDICRLYLEDVWYTAQLVVDPIAEGNEDEVFVFQSRDPVQRHALTKDALVRLRADGLATTVEPGAFIAKALDTMPADLETTRLPRRRPR